MTEQTDTGAFFALCNQVRNLVFEKSYYDACVRDACRNTIESMSGKVPELPRPTISRLLPPAMQAQGWVRIGNLADYKRADNQPLITCRNTDIISCLVAVNGTLPKLEFEVDENIPEDDLEMALSRMIANLVYNFTIAVLENVLPTPRFASTLIYVFTSSGTRDADQLVYTEAVELEAVRTQGGTEYSIVKQTSKRSWPDTMVNGRPQQLSEFYVTLDGTLSLIEVEAIRRTIQAMSAVSSPPNEFTPYRLSVSLRQDGNIDSAMNTVSQLPGVVKVSDIFQ